MIFPVSAGDASYRISSNPTGQKRTNKIGSCPVANAKRSATGVASRSGGPTLLDAIPVNARR